MIHIWAKKRCEFEVNAFEFYSKDTSPFQKRRQATHFGTVPLLPKKLVTRQQRFLQWTSASRLAARLGPPARCDHYQHDLTWLRMHVSYNDGTQTFHLCYHLDPEGGLGRKLCTTEGLQRSFESVLNRFVQAHRVRSNVVHRVNA